MAKIPKAERDQHFDLVAINSRVNRGLTLLIELLEDFEDVAELARSVQNDNRLLREKIIELRRHREQEVNK